MRYLFGIVDTCSIHKIVGFEQNYIIDFSNGCWCILENDNVDIISKLIGKTVDSDDLLRSNISLVPLLKKLFYQGVLTINNKSYYKQTAICGVEDYLTVVINTTNRCNLSCKYCYAYSNKKSGTNFSAESIIDVISKLDIKQHELRIVFHGGEPLLCSENIIEMVTKLKARFDNISFSIQTNGTLIDKQIIDFAKCNKIKIGISIDGYNQETNINRFSENRNDFLERVLKNIELLVLNNIDVGLLSVITTENYKHLFENVIHFSEKGIKNFGFNFFVPAGRGIAKTVEISTEELVDIYVKLACYINDYNSMHERDEYISERTISVLIFALTHQPLGACFSTPCCAGQNLIAINVNGDVYPCDEFIGNQQFCIGNVYDTAFSMQNIKNEYFMLLTQRDSSSLEECGQCQINKLCPFKCPSDSYYRTGSLFHVHSMCNFTKLILPRYMYLLQSGIINSKYFIFN